MRRLFACLTPLLLLSAACQTHPPAPPPATQPLAVGELAPPTPIPDVSATVTPPLGWVKKELIKDPDNTHQVFESPSGDTAYGVIAFNLPLPVPASWVYPRFVANMKEREGEGTIVVPRQDDPTLPGLRFTVDSPEFRMRVNLITRGFKGWAVYAGTRRDRPERAEELRLAELAREGTTVGR